MLITSLIKTLLYLLFCFFFTEVNCLTENILYFLSFTGAEVCSAVATCEGTCTLTINILFAILVYLVAIFLTSVYNIQVLCLFCMSSDAGSLFNPDPC